MKQAQMVSNWRYENKITILPCRLISPSVEHLQNFITTYKLNSLINDNYRALTSLNLIKGD